MHVYNAIIVLKEILPVFPLAGVVDIGSGLHRAMTDFLKREKRGDLKVICTA
jgi:THO complex subunit 2